MSSAWSLVAFKTASGQTTGAFSETPPTGTADSDLIVVHQMASSVGYDLGWGSVGWTHEVDTSASLATQEVRTWAKIAQSETSWSLNSSGSPFYLYIISTWRWTGGYANLGNLTGYRGTQDVVSNYSGASPQNSTAGTYTPSLPGDNLGFWVMSVRTNGSNSGLGITPDAGITMVDNHNYPDAHMTLALGYETQPTSFGNRTAAFAYTAGGGSMSHQNGLLVMEQGVASTGGGAAWAWTA